MPPVLIRLADSPEGAFPVAAAHLAASLEGCPNETTYAAYFQAMEDFLAADGHAALARAVSRRLGRPVAPREIVRIELRAQKHGAYYHPASLDALTADGARVRLCLLVATALLGFLAMEEEYETLAALNAAFPWGLLPEVHAQADRGDMAFMLAEWIEDHHEYHVAADGRFVLWDFNRGRAILAPDQARAVFEQAAALATLYYDPETGRRIHPWHHAAGDFIVGLAPDGLVSARLCSARGYEPILAGDGRPGFRREALAAFFLDLGLRLRLDRVEGVGETVFLGPEVLRAGLDGFFSALARRGLAEEGRDLARRLAGLGHVGLVAMLGERLAGFGETDRAVLEKNLSAHARSLAEEL